MNTNSLVGEPIDPKTASRKVEFAAHAGAGTLLDYGMADCVSSVESKVALAALKHKARGYITPVETEYADVTAGTVTGL